MKHPAPVLCGLLLIVLASAAPVRAQSHQLPDIGHDNNGGGGGPVLFEPQVPLDILLMFELLFDDGPGEGFAPGTVVYGNLCLRRGVHHETGGLFGWIGETGDGETIWIGPAGHELANPASEELLELIFFAWILDYLDHQDECDTEQTTHGSGL
ncbi:MAG: hypothetical protein R3236_05710 [Phycisphaeraceae bacterium]|nr:hypothetical protein [Phycisphaeraceae bacterium]